MESTYGGRTHELSTDSSEHLCRDHPPQIQQRRKLIIPAFAVERTQQLLYTFDKLRHDKCFAPIPTFVDSPLAVQSHGDLPPPHR
jgi:metallo-beta-lactamase family protein